MPLAKDILSGLSKMVMVERSFLFGCLLLIDFTCWPLYNSLIYAYVLQSSKICTSDSTDPGGKEQNLSFLRILGLLYLPVSSTKLHSILATVSEETTEVFYRGI